MRGDPATLTWTGTGQTNAYFEVYTADASEARSLRCTAPDTGSFTIPGSLTAQLLPRAPTIAWFTFQRRSYRTIEPASAFVLQEVYLARQIRRQLNYQP